MLQRLQKYSTNKNPPGGLQWLKNILSHISQRICQKDYQLQKHRSGKTEFNINRVDLLRKLEKVTIVY